MEGTGFSIRQALVKQSMSQHINDKEKKIYKNKREMIRLTKTANIGKQVVYYPSFVYVYIMQA